MERAEIAQHYSTQLDGLLDRYEVLVEKPRVAEEFYPELRVAEMEKLAKRGMWAYYKELDSFGLGIEARVRIKQVVE